MALHLPKPLQAAIEQALSTSPTARWVADAQALSERYRSAQRPAGVPLASGSRAALAYAALILPATYAQLYGALAAVLARLPGWQPQTLLDIGSGPGTALWAAASHWPTLSQAVAWEREPAFIALGQTLAQAGPPPVQAAYWQQVDLHKTTQLATQNSALRTQTYDLVILGHVLNELDIILQAQVVSMAWGLTRGVLLIVEPGTAAAFTVVRAARDQLLPAGAHTIAPCTHDLPCPLTADWCHFPQRLVRPAFQRRARGAPSEWEDAKFSYAALARFAPATPAWGRVIREVVWNKAYAELTVSSAEGVDQYQVLKRQREAFRAAREVEWGALVDAPPTGSNHD